jgi:hypothetical protein
LGAIVRRLVDNEVPLDPETHLFISWHSARCTVIDWAGKKGKDPLAMILQMHSKDPRMATRYMRDHLTLPCNMVRDLVKDLQAERPEPHDQPRDHRPALELGPKTSPSEPEARTSTDIEPVGKEIKLVTEGNQAKSVFVSSSGSTRVTRPSSPSSSSSSSASEDDPSDQEGDEDFQVTFF